MFNKAGIAGLLLSVVATHASAAPASNTQQAARQVQSSMLVTGTIEVNTDGTVATHSIDQVAKLPKGVAGFIDKNVASWTFKPVTHEGRAAKLHNRMNLLLVARKLDGDKYLIRMQAANFLPLRQETQKGHEVARRQITPPSYPSRVLSDGVTGTVYLLMKIGRDGRVQDVIAEQVNLRALGSQSQMTRWRNGLADASVRAARNWTYTPPTQGAWVDEPFWMARTPVDFDYYGSTPVGYGEWSAYIPGPRQSNPWAKQAEAEASPEALAAGGLQQVGSEELKLLTPLGEQG